MENVAHSFVVVAVDATEFPPRHFSTAFWGVPPKCVADSIAGAVAIAYERLKSGDIEIRIVPITA